MFVVKRFISDGNAVNIDLGFVPEFVHVISDIDATSPDIYEWNKAMEDESTAQYGILVTGTTGVVTELTTAATGIVEYDAVTYGVNVPDPAGGADQFRVPTTWATTTDYSSGYNVRTATSAGDIVYPPTRNGRVFELTTGTGAGTSEPSSWDVNPGETVTDSGSNVFTCRVETVTKSGAQGITMGATSQTDGDVCIVNAWKADHYSNGGDAGDVPSGGAV